jgi:Uma2 family endonuclease
MNGGSIAMTALAAVPRSTGVWTADQFLDFYMTRPENERWQLVDGLAMMMVPPTVLHQKIAKNLLLLIDNTLESKRPHLICLHEVGIRIPGVEGFNPQPDITVFKTDADFDRYVDEFYLVVEVISPSNTAEMIERKMELYRTHPDNIYCLTVDQDSVHVTLWSRDGGWLRSDFCSLDDLLRLPAFGFESALREIYKGTPLA